MLKIIKSKAFKVAGLALALALAFVVSSSASAATTTTTTTTTVNASAYNYSGVMKVGSKGPGVATLQAALNSVNTTTIIVDSSFGPATKAAVVQFQASHGLTADGVVGPKTGAALSAATVAVITVPGTPGCAAGAMYNSMNGSPCTTTTTTVAGCAPGAMFNSMTGAACTNNSTVSMTGPLSINTVTASSGYTATNVGVGNQNKQVADLRVVTGAGGSGNLTGLNVTFKNTATGGDYMFTKYASSVSVWENGVQVGSLPASSFTSYNNAFSAYIPLSGAMLAPSTTTDLYIAVSALPVIDTANLGSGNNNFTITGVSLRYSDSTGSAFQYSVADSNLANSTFVFNTAASSNSIKLNVTKDATDATDHTFQGSASSNTQNVTLATVDLNAQGSNISIQSLPVTVGVLTTIGSPATSNVSDVVSTLRLYNSAGVMVDSETVPADDANCTGTSLSGVTNAQCATVTFRNFSNNGLAITSGSTNVFTIKGDINTVNGTTVSSGTYIVAEITSADVLAIQAYDANNNRISTSTYLTGSTTGSKNYVYVNGINVASSGTASNLYTAPAGGTGHGSATMTIPFSVSAYGATSYIPSTAVCTTAAASGSATHVEYTVTQGGTATCIGVTGVLQYNASGSTTGSSLTADTNGNYVISAGQTANFNLVIGFSPAAAGLFRAFLVNVPSNLTDSNSTYTMNTAGLTATQYQTPYQNAQ